MKRQLKSLECFSKVKWQCCRHQPMYVTTYNIVLSDIFGSWPRGRRQNDLNLNAAATKNPFTAEVFPPSYLFVFSRWRVSLFSRLYTSDGHFICQLFYADVPHWKKSRTSTVQTAGKNMHPPPPVRSLLYLDKKRAQMAALLFQSVRPGASADSDTEMPLTEWFSGAHTPADKLVIVATVMWFQRFLSP